MKMLRLQGGDLHYDRRGSGPAVVFANSLGTDFRLWDGLVAALPGHCLIRYDMRGHGLSSAPEGDYFMGDLVAEAAALLDHLQVQDCVFVGLSIGGMVAQGLAAERPDLLRGLVLSNTAAKIGTPGMWRGRMETIAKEGIGALADPILERWFSPRFRRENPTALRGWRNMLTRTPRAGYLGCCAAIAETDLYESTARLTLPTLAIAGADDGATPPDLVRETADLVRGARFRLIRGAGHLPCVEQPDEYAAILMEFMQEIGHVQGL